MAEVRGHQDEIVLAKPVNQCWCKWNWHADCPNDWTHVIENTKNPGYMKCCEQHKEGFLRLGPEGIKVWTKDEWVAADRERLLNELILAEGRKLA